MKFTPKLMVYLAVLGFAVAGMAWSKYILRTHNDAPRDYYEIAEEGTLRVGIEYNPTSYFVSGDSIIGFDYELCKMIERRSGLRLEIYPQMNLATSMKQLNDREIDVVARQMPITVNIKEDFSITEPIDINKQVLVQIGKKEDAGPIRNQIDLGGKTVYIPLNSPARERLINLSHEIADSIFWQEDPLYGQEQLIIKVATGQIEYAICDQNIARRMQKLYPQIDVDTDISFNQFRGWALRKESIQLLDSLNQWLREAPTPRN